VSRSPRNSTPHRITWYAADGLGSVRRAFNGASATPLGIVTYDPWGTPESGTVPTFGFTGELQDATTGLVNLRARWYSTNQGRFTTRDPFAGFPEEPQTLANYAYVHDNPINSVDPTGQWRWNNPSGSGPPYHRVIEDEYAEYDPTGQNIHLEYRVYKKRLIPEFARPIRWRAVSSTMSNRVDILRSDTGDVWEIEPITRLQHAVPEATQKVDLLRYWGIEVQNPVLYCDDCGDHNYNWNTVDWHLGNPANFPTQRKELWDTSALGLQTILVAEATEPGAIIYHLERNEKVEVTEAGLAAMAAAAALFRKLGQGRAPRRRPEPAFEFCPGFPYIFIPLPAEPDVGPYLPDPLPTYPPFPGTAPVPPVPDPRSLVA